MDIDKMIADLKEDAAFLEEALEKIESSNFHDREHGIGMLRDQVHHMKERIAEMK